jgi:SPX domain protein involved in polyphosphate accumulation
MKFAKYLESEGIPEWRKAYINYKGLKKRLKAIEKVSFPSCPFLFINICNILNKVIIQYRRLNEEEETTRLEHAINVLDSSGDDMESQQNLHQPRTPVRSQTLDNRRLNRTISSGLLNRFSNSFRFKRQETELGRLTRPSIPGTLPIRY